MTSFDQHDENHLRKLMAEERGPQPKPLWPDKYDSHEWRLIRDQFRRKGELTVPDLVNLTRLRPDIIKAVLRRHQAIGHVKRTNLSYTHVFKLMPLGDQ